MNSTFSSRIPRITVVAAFSTVNTGNLRFGRRNKTITDKIVPGNDRANRNVGPPLRDIGRVVNFRYARILTPGNWEASVTDDASVVCPRTEVSGLKTPRSTGVLLPRGQCINVGRTREIDVIIRNYTLPRNGLSRKIAEIRQLSGRSLRTVRGG